MSSAFTILTILTETRNGKADIVINKDKNNALNK